MASTGPAQAKDDKDSSTRKNTLGSLMYDVMEWVAIGVSLFTSLIAIVLIFPRNLMIWEPKGQLRKTGVNGRNSSKEYKSSQMKELSTSSAPCSIVSAKDSEIPREKEAQDNPSDDTSTLKEKSEDSLYRSPTSSANYATVSTQDSVSEIPRDKAQDSHSDDTSTEKSEESQTSTSSENCGIDSTKDSVSEMPSDKAQDYDPSRDISTQKEKSEETPCQPPNCSGNCKIVPTQDSVSETSTDKEAQDDTSGDLSTKTEESDESPYRSESIADASPGVDESKESVSDQSSADIAENGAAESGDSEPQEN